MRNKLQFSDVATEFLDASGAKAGPRLRRSKEEQGPLLFEHRRGNAANGGASGEIQEESSSRSEQSQTQQPQAERPAEGSSARQPQPQVAEEAQRRQAKGREAGGMRELRGHQEAQGPAVAEGHRLAVPEPRGRGLARGRQGERLGRPQRRPRSWRPVRQSVVGEQRSRGPDRQSTAERLVIKNNAIELGLRR